MANTSIKVLYHSPCDDGFGAAWAAWKFFEGKPYSSNQVHYIPVSYGDKVCPGMDVNDTVYIVDFSYKRKILEPMHQLVDFLQVIDHHKSAEKELAGLSYCLFDMKRSGAMMTWDYFHSQREAPPLLKYVQDNDLFTHALQSSQAVTRWIRSWPYDFEKWNHLNLRMTLDMTGVIREAIAIERYFQVQMRSAMDNYIHVNFAGIPVVVVNCNKTFVSEACHNLIKECGVDVAIGWFMRNDGRIELSLRGNGKVDVSELATQFGGGGHAKAAGFHLDVNNFISRFKLNTL